MWALTRPRKRSGPTTSTTGAGRGIVALLVDPTFAPYFYVKTATASGIWLGNVAAAMLMFDLTRSPFMVATVTMSQFLGPLVLAPWAGALADRIDRRGLLIVGRAVSGLGVTPLTVMLFLRGPNGYAAEVMLLVAVLVLGVGFALTAPAGNALIPALVPDEDLDTALALNAASASIARTVGPPIGALLMLTNGPALAFAIVAATQFAFCVVLAFVRPLRRGERPASRPRLLGGLRYLLDDRKAGMLMLGVALLNVGADPSVTLAPPLAAQLGGHADLVGLFATSFGVGSLVVTVTLRPLRRRLDLRMLGVVGFLAMSAGLMVCAVPGHQLVPAVGLLVTGAGFMLGNIALTTRIQRRVPDVLRGRVMAIWGMAFMGARPIAAGVNGAIAQYASVRVALLVAALIVLASAGLARTSYRTRLP